MRPTDQTKRFAIENYIEPARHRGETQVQIRVGTIIKELGWRNRTPSVYSTLISEEFQRQAGVRLLEKSGGPASGGPSTTWTLRYELQDKSSLAQPPKPEGGLLSFFGSWAAMFQQVGGSEAFLRSLREDFGSVAPDSVGPASNATTRATTREKTA
jgi:hypothetical protein